MGGIPGLSYSGLATGGYAVNNGTFYIGTPNLQSLVNLSAQTGINSGLSNSDNMLAFNLGIGAQKTVNSPVIKAGLGSDGLILLAGIGLIAWMIFK